MNEAKKISSKQYKCDSCGANLEFSPKNQGLCCPNCNTEVATTESKDFVKHDCNETNYKRLTNVSWQTTEKVFKCNNCGANVILGAKEYSQNCPYCACALVADDSEIASIKPDQIIPFKFDKQEAVGRFKDGVKKKWFLPNEFKKNVPSTNLYGVYLPSFIFDTKLHANYSGTFYKDEKQGEEVISTMFSVSGTKDFEFNDHMIESSSLINQRTLNSIKPYHTEDLLDYKNQYILGYAVECYDKRVEDCLAQAESVMSSSARNIILSEISYDRIGTFNVHNVFYDEKYSYSLLPCYEVKFDYKGKKYDSFMNGQTGKVGSGLPLSKIKIFFFVLTILAIIGGTIALALLSK